MAQQYTKILRSIWQDPEFIALPFDSKMVYVMLISQPDINPCGVVGLRLNRWASLFPDRTAKQLAKALSPLVAERFIIIDEATEEVLARTFIRHDAGWKQTNGLTSIENGKRGVLSQQLRQVIDDIVSTLTATVKPTVDETVDSTVPSRALLDPLTSPSSFELKPESSSPTAAATARTVSPTTQKRREEEERNLRKSDIAKSYADELWGRANQPQIRDALAFRRKNIETAMNDPEMERVVDVMTWPAESIGRAMATGMTRKVTDTSKESGARLVNGAWLAKGVAG